MRRVHWPWHDLQRGKGEVDRPATRAELDRMRPLVTHRPGRVLVTPVR